MRHLGVGGRAVAVLLWVGALLALPAAATTFTFALVADTATSIPSGTGAFPVNAFGTPAVDGGAVVFTGGLGANHGIYSDAGGGLHAVVKHGDAIPSGTGGFSVLDPQHFDGGVVPFRGTGSGQLGIYSVSAGGGAVVRVADLSTAIPGGTGNFQQLSGGPDFSAGSHLFVSTSVGIYQGSPGALSVVADTTTAVPGGTGSFSSFSGATLSEGQVAFRAGGASGAGVYTTSGGGLALVANNGTPIPNGLGSFSTVGVPVVDDGIILFSGSGINNQFGLYTSASGILGVVADVSTQAPGGTGTFVSFGFYGVDDGAVVFTATDFGANLALYTTLGGSLVRVVGVGDTLDGKTVSNVQIGLDPISGNTIAFLASFGDGSQGIYTATSVPEPGVLALLAVAGMLGARRRG